MKRFLLLAWVLLAPGLLTPHFSHAQDQGIQFEQGSWEEALALAQDQDKPIFVDAYASWCGPCKKMSRNVFTQSQVGDFFNENFVNIKLDMEKAEARSFRRKHAVRAYPTLFFIQPNGEVLLRKTGYQNGNNLLKLARYAVQPEASRVHRFTQAYQQGRKDTAFLYAYMLELNQVGQSVEKPLADYWKRVEPAAITQNRVFSVFYAFENDLDARPTQYFIEHYDDVRQQMGKYAGKKATTLLQKNFEKAIQLGDEAMIGRLKELADVFYGPQQAAQVKQRIQQAYSRQQ